MCGGIAASNTAATYEAHNNNAAIALKPETTITPVVATAQETSADTKK
jgi:hypothetical protein